LYSRVWRIAGILFGGIAMIMTEDRLLELGSQFLDTVQQFQNQQKTLIAAGNALARSLGHLPQDHNRPLCPKISPAVPCTCGEGVKQAQALSDWEHLTMKIKLDTDSGS